MNRLVLQRLTEQEDPEGSGKSELDQLAGTWREPEAEAFLTTIAPLQQIDPELWGWSVRAIALDTNTYVGSKRGDERCVEVIHRAERLLLWPASLPVKTNQR